jgi:hypothetical protein
MYKLWLNLLTKWQHNIIISRARICMHLKVSKYAIWYAVKIMKICKKYAVKIIKICKKYAVKVMKICKKYGRIFYLFKIYNLTYDN